MITARTLKFLKQLAANNNKEWMDANRGEYEYAKQNYLELVTAVLKEMTAFEPGFADIPAKGCIFRLNRDVRFSEDKSPYKTHFGAFFSTGGKKSPNAGYYFHLQPGACFLAGGAWMPPADMLKNIRQEIDYDLPGFEAIVNDKAFKKLYGGIEGEQLKKAPQGYAIDNPAIEYLRFKSFTVTSPLTDDAVTDKAFAKKLAGSFKVMQPFIGFLNRGLA